MAVTTDYQGYLLFAFENGKAAKVPLSAYATKTRRRKLANAYSDKARLVQALQLAEDARCSSPPAIPGCSLSTPA